MVGLGFKQSDGNTLEGFDHVRQSLQVIFTTPLRTRVMRREFGCELFDLIDRPMTDKVILAIYASVVSACSLWEPRYEITQCTYTNVAATGVVELSLVGNYFPRGHLGDKSTVYNDTPLFLTIGKNQ